MLTFNPLLPHLRGNSACKKELFIIFVPYSFPALLVALNRDEMAAGPADIREQHEYAPPFPPLSVLRVCILKNYLKQ